MPTHPLFFLDVFIVKPSLLFETLNNPLQKLTPPLHKKLGQNFAEVRFLKFDLHYQKCYLVIYCAKFY